MADESWKIVAFIVFLVIALAVIYFEFKLLRRRKEREAKTGTLEDQAHNAILTTRAISSTLARGGVRSEEANDLLGKAESARQAGDHRIALDYAASAKAALMKEKQRHQSIGDLVKLPEKGGGTAPAEETTKEKLQKEMPKNYLQARFMLGHAQQAIEQGGREGRGVSEASRLLGLAQKSFDDRDYDASLKFGVQARRVAEGMAIEVDAVEAVTVGVSIEAKGLACASCGALLAAGDVFCRKCGVKVEAKVCTSCGTKPREGDTFCRKCGIALG